MRLLGRNHLQTISGLNAQTDSWLTAWVYEIVNANWKEPIDLVKQYRSVIQLNNSTYLFQVTAFDGFVELHISFQQGIALITAIKKS
jgi:mRNA-degrading endonuclease HigB of HigAB toxin-antitoxin module